jgi:hypothetical protein
MIPEIEDHLKRFIQRTDQLCLVDAQAASIRHNLLEIERKGHATGWDGPNSDPRIFQIDAHHTKPDIVLNWCETYTNQLGSLCETVFDGNVGKSLSELARLWTILADFFRTGEAPDSLTGDIIRAFGNSIGRPDIGPDRDLLGNRCQRGYRLHGLGLRTEAWAAADSAEEIAKLAASGRPLSEYIGRKEMRAVWYSARDGSMWTVVRQRGERPWSAQVPNGTSLGIGGDVANALSRFVNALASTDVPIVPVHPEMPAVLHDNAYGDNDRR